MRPLALSGLIVSLLLGGLAVFETSEGVRARRNEQDRALQAAVSSEIALISGGERQTTTALSLMLVNPAVRQLVGDQTLSPRARRSDLTDTAQALAAIQHSSFLPLSAACLDGGGGQQLICGPSPAPTVFPRGLGRQFLALAGSSPLGAASGAFLSPATGQLSVAFLAPFRVRGRLRGLVHLDIDIATTRGSSLLVNSTPDVNVQLGSYEGGRVLLNGPSSTLTSSGLGSAASVPVAGPALGQRPQSTLNDGHRAMVAALPLTIGGARQNVAVTATAASADPAFFNAWDSWMLSVLGIAF
ncbi:MAG TPA: hypothetical protein VK252_08010, partial [Solirubrobacteraceae bacterium]|nr:hypothetical protein [Solirubrobacteraceae bacterium]